jgi:hypothetical protein
MRINITGTRPGKAKPKGGRKKSEAAPGKAKLTRAQKIRKRRAAARERRHVVGVGRYRITLHPDAASTNVIVYGSAKLHGDDDTEGYPGRLRSALHGDVILALTGYDDTEGYASLYRSTLSGDAGAAPTGDTEGYPGKPSPPPPIVPDEQPGPRKERGS